MLDLGCSLVRFVTVGPTVNRGCLGPVVDRLSDNVADRYSIAVVSLPYVVVGIGKLKGYVVGTLRYAALVKSNGVKIGIGESRGDGASRVGLIRNYRNAYGLLSNRNGNGDLA